MYYSRARGIAGSNNNTLHVSGELLLLLFDTCFYSLAFSTFFLSFTSINRNTTMCYWKKLTFVFGNSQVKRIACHCFLLSVSMDSLLVGSFPQSYSYSFTTTGININSSSSSSSFRFHFFLKYYKIIKYLCHCKLQAGIFGGVNVMSTITIQFQVWPFNVFNYFIATDHLRPCLDSLILLNLFTHISTCETFRDNL